MPEIFMIAAVARNGVIGADNDMPWTLSSDLKHFKKLTLGKPVVMGRKTFLSFGGKPLPGRPHIVISRDPDYQPNGAEAATSLDEALRLAGKQAVAMGADEIAIIGGGQIYAQAMPRADRLEITEVAADPQGDTRFPDIDPAVWTETSRVPGGRTDKDSADFTFVTYHRLDSTVNA
ncbi:dihydrofolate reductase [Roseibium denhamense]|uniref:Dihydrofolate reductase n=1 Tax=Roseibium denhamense TaxID=76305 RepID=A0ABY1NAV2_9HYPH|nr:dihydrofolate reductase [Roseibium denhamense]MTI06529.1 dihydrofolate reductase [Roseibium denhamense]SMP04632.1 dihydrofolate reductase [Roseibium denhamense]